MNWTGFGNSSGYSGETFAVLFSHRAIVASVILGLTLIGLFGNLLVIVAVIVAKKLRTITNILVVNLAFADLVTCTCLPFLSAGLFSQTESYPLPEIVCALVAGALSTCMFCSASSIVAIAFVRWYVITRAVRGNQGLHMRKKIAILVVIIWIASITFTMLLTVSIGIEALEYKDVYGLCVLYDETTNLDNLFVATFIVISLTLTLIFYLLVFRHVFRHNRQIRDNLNVAEDTTSSTTHQNKDSSEPRQPKIHGGINKMEVDVTKNLFIVVCAFILCFLATGVNVLVPDHDTFTLYGLMFLASNSVINPIIYGLKHPNFREVFKNILCCRATRV